MQSLIENAMTYCIFASNFEKYIFVCYKQMDLGVSFWMEKEVTS